MTKPHVRSAERDADEAAVRHLEAAYDEAWGVGDVDGILACLADDVVVVNPRGGVAQGHAEVRRELETLFSGEFAASSHTSEVLRVSFVTSDVVIVDGRAIIKGADPSEPTFVHGYTDVLVRRGTRWVIGHVRAYGLA